MACFVYLCSLESGITQKLPNEINSVNGKAEIYQSETRAFDTEKHSLSREGWTVIDSLSFNKLLRPAIHYGYQFNSSNQQRGMLTNLPVLSPQAVNAINKAPVWMQADLENVLNQLVPEKQILWADVINNASDPYIDEIAFCIAHSSTLWLESSYANPQLFIDNANLIYAIDQDLSYVQIINHGSSTTDPDYYSTTKYTKIDTLGQITQLEAPKEIYYWYIVHPKTSDEIPAYINPTIIEDNDTHDNNITAPNEGKFWRQSFYYEHHENHPILKDMLDSCSVVFNPNNSNDDAIHKIQAWINSVMSFTSNTERPHQPVRIYEKGFGRCGEYGDFTMAATRSALIPCTSILSASTDHVWNEFWDTEWHHWEPVNNDINHPLVYENGWGKVFGSVMEIRSDGYLTPITARYSESSATINIHVLDNQQHPVDGASVKLAMDDNGTIRFDNLGYSDNNGLCQFIVGDGRHYYVRVDSPLGSTPTTSSEYLDVIENISNGMIYDYQLVINNSLLSLENIVVNCPADETDDYRLNLSLLNSKQIISGLVAWDDIDVLGQRPIFYKETNLPGKVNAYFMNYDQYSSYQLPNFPFEAFNTFNSISQAESQFDVPANYHVFASLDNYASLKNLQSIDGVIYLEQYGLAQDDNSLDIQQISLNQNYPNPFNPDTCISFNLSTPGMTNLSIFNIKGQLVKTLCAKNLSKGSHKFTWDGKSDSSKVVTSGVYFYRLKHNDSTLIKKMILMK